MLAMLRTSDVVLLPKERLNQWEMVPLPPFDSLWTGQALLEREPMDTNTWIPAFAGMTT